MDAIIWMMIGLLEIGLKMMFMVFTHIILPICGFLLNVIFGLVATYPKTTLIGCLVVVAGFMLTAML